MFCSRSLRSAFLVLALWLWLWCWGQQRIKWRNDDDSSCVAGADWWPPASFVKNSNVWFFAASTLSVKIRGEEKLK
jgi:hypothetical protein